MENKSLNGFEKIFRSRELGLIEGPGKVNFTIVTILYFVTFFAIAYALQGLGELKKRMDNPFTNWVDLEIPYEKRDQVHAMQADFQKNVLLQDSFQLNELKGYSLLYQSFYNAKEHNYRECYGRTIDLDEALCDFVLSPENNTNLLVQKDKWNNCGIVATYHMLETLGITDPKKEAKILIRLSIGNNHSSDKMDYILLWIPVFAVVNSLPQNAEFLLTPCLYNSLVQPFVTTGFVRLTTNIAGLITMNKPLKEEALGINGSGIQGQDSEEVNGIYSNRFFNNNFYLSEPHPLDSLSNLQLHAQINTSGLVGAYSKWDCITGFDLLDRPQYLSFYFKELNKVKQLKDYLKEKYALQLDMSSVEDKENFSKVSILTSVTTIILFLMGLGSLSLFMWFFLKNHLQNSARNLGTLTAFGLRADTISSIYVRMINTFMLRACLTAFMILLILIGMGYAITGKILGDILNPFFIASVVVAFLLNTFIAKRSISSILSNTPGNLIYGRN